MMVGTRISLICDSASLFWGSQESGHRWLLTSHNHWWTFPLSAPPSSISEGLSIRLSALLFCDQKVDMWLHWEFEWRVGRLQENSRFALLGCSEATVPQLLLPGVRVAILGLFVFLQVFLAPKNTNLVFSDIQGLVISISLSWFSLDGKDRVSQGCPDNEGGKLLNYEESWPEHHASTGHLLFSFYLVIFCFNILIEALNNSLNLN